MLITTAGQSKMNTCLSVYLCSYPNSHESCHKVLGYGSWNNADTGRTIQLMFISVGEIQWSHWAPKNLLNSWQPHTQQTPEFTQSGTKKGRKKLFFFLNTKTITQQVGSSIGISTPWIIAVAEVHYQADPANRLQQFNQ